LVSLDLKPNLCQFLHALIVPADAEGHQRPAVWKALPTASAILPVQRAVLNHSCGTISSVKWTGVQPVALRLGVIVFAPSQI